MWLDVLGHADDHFRLIGQKSESVADDSFNLLRLAAGQQRRRQFAHNRLAQFEGIALQFLGMFTLFAEYARQPVDDRFQTEADLLLDPAQRVGHAILATLLVGRRLGRLQFFDGKSRRRVGQSLRLAPGARVGFRLQTVLRRFVKAVVE